jgi:hypothetical protein
MPPTPLPPGVTVLDSAGSTTIDGQWFEDVNTVARDTPWLHAVMTHGADRSATRPPAARTSTICSVA